jgi:short-subunit dehydrogenase
MISLFNIGVNRRQGKWALVTGASSGIGLAFAEKLASLGMNLAITARRVDRLEALAARLAGRYNISVEICRADLAEPEGPPALYEFTEGKRIVVEFLVNNAGVGGYGEFRTSGLARQLEMVRLNCAAVVHLTHLYLPAMVARRGGEIVITASTAAFQPTPYIAVYGASKAFDLMFAEALAEEVERHGIRVCALCPGPTESEFHAVAGVPEEGNKGRVPVGPVVEAALRALDSGKHMVIPGTVNRWQVHLQRLAPRRFVSGAAERMLRPPSLATDEHR